MFRCTIRDLLWLTVVVALAVGWWVERANAARMASERDLLVRLLANENTPRWQLSPELLRATRPLER
jgi:hypothetical protein